MTFSIVARSLNGTHLGVAVASKFVAVGAVVPAAAAGVGALATQAWANLAYRPNGLALLRAGQGAEATPGSKVTVHYTGWMFDHTRPDRKGAEFDSSRKSGQPFSFVLGQQQVIAGWDQGVAGMKTGGQRRLGIPSALAYGERGAGGVIAPGATLVFDVELLAVQPPR